MQYLVTGAAGFIGFHVCLRLLESGHRVVGVDNLNDYYSVTLKKDRLGQINSSEFFFEPMDVADRDAVKRLFASNRFDKVIHLAAQAGVRYSLTNPTAYIDSNLVGFGNILEGCRDAQAMLVYASSSSVYGANRRLPFSTNDPVDHPVSLCAATKKANELMAHSYSHLFGLPTIGLRFFTVYGPWGRPDMAAYKFTKAISEGKPLQLYNHGNMRRDFTYIDDIAEGVVRTSLLTIQGDDEWNALEPEASRSAAPYRIFNIGASSPENIMDLVESIAESVGRKPIIEYAEMQDGDVLETYADVSDLEQEIDFSPQVPLRDGIQRFAAWYCEYHNL